MQNCPFKNIVTRCLFIFNRSPASAGRWALLILALTTSNERWRHHAACDRYSYSNDVSIVINLWQYPSGLVRGMHWPYNYIEVDCLYTIGPPGSEMELIHAYTTRIALLKLLTHFTKRIDPRHHTLSVFNPTK